MEIIEEQIKSLRDELDRHNYNYYVLSNPTISDLEFDMKMKELQKLEEEHPEFDAHEACRKRYFEGISAGGAQVCDAFAGQYLFRRRCARLL